MKDYYYYCYFNSYTESNFYLLVDDDESLLVAITHFFLECDDFLHSFVNELSLSLYKLFPFGCTLVEEPRVYLTARSTHYDDKNKVCEKYLVPGLGEGRSLTITWEILSQNQELGKQNRMKVEKYMTSMKL